MALLTLPVVIVSTEEGLRRVPESLKNGAMALGATKYEMIRKIVIPIASPSIVTGGILAIARAAGEVAPLLLVGAVMSAPVLPIDNEFPYIHLERQFMHLGVLVFDGVFHSQTSISASSMMFATCLLLILIVLVLNSMASWLRYRLKQQYDWQ
jgi:phosphate transport system permease protein